MTLHHILSALVLTLNSPVEYMEYGSLHDLLRNETMALSGEIILQISRDVAQGLRFLHSSRPPLLHGYVHHIFSPSFTSKPRL